MFPIQTLFTLAVGIFFFMYWLVSFMVIYHLTRFGIGTLPKKLAATFLMGSVLLFSTCVVLFLNLDLSKLIK